MYEFVGQAFHIVGAAPGIDLLADEGFLLNIDLGITGTTCREVRRQGDSLIESIGVQRLGMPQSGCHSFDTGTSDIVERILLRQRPA